MRSLLACGLLLGWVLWVGDMRQGIPERKILQQYPTIEGQGLTAQQLCTQVKSLVEARHTGQPRQFRCLPEGTQP
jgi:hypothetical protein